MEDQSEDEGQSQDNIRVGIIDRRTWSQEETSVLIADVLADIDVYTGPFYGAINRQARTKAWTDLAKKISSMPGATICTAKQCKNKFAKVKNEGMFVGIEAEASRVWRAKLERWSKSRLVEWLKCRGAKCTGNKNALVSRVSLWQMMHTSPHPVQKRKKSSNIPDHCLIFCCVPYCGNTSAHSGKILPGGAQLRLHQFPADDQLQRRWVARIRRVRSSLIVNSDTRICNVHFVDYDINNEPTIFPSRPSRRLPDQSHVRIHDLPVVEVEPIADGEQYPNPGVDPHPDVDPDPAMPVKLFPHVPVLGEVTEIYFDPSIKQEENAKSYSNPSIKVEEDMETYYNLSIKQEEMETSSDASITQKEDPESYSNQSMKPEENIEMHSEPSIKQEEDFELNPSVKQECMNDAEVFDPQVTGLLGNQENDQTMDNPNLKQVSRLDQVSIKKETSDKFCDTEVTNSYFDDNTSELRIINQKNNQNLKQLSSGQVSIKEEPEDEYHDTEVTNSYFDDRTSEPWNNRSPEMDAGQLKPEMDASESLDDSPEVSNTSQTGSVTLVTFDLHGNLVQKPVTIDDSTCELPKNRSPRIDAGHLKPEMGLSESLDDLPGASSTGQTGSATSILQKILPDDIEILTGHIEDGKCRIKRTENYSGTTNGIQSRTEPTLLGLADQEDVVELSKAKDRCPIEKCADTRHQVFPDKVRLKSGELGLGCANHLKGHMLTQQQGHQYAQLTHSKKKPFVCPECQKCFSQLEHLESHMITHADESSRTYESNLKQNRIPHSEEKIHGCEICGKKFSSNDKLKIHMIAHSSTKSHKCTLCEKVFQHFSSLNRHMIVHSDKRPHKCGKCGKCFHNSMYLNYHMKSHTEKVRHICEVCGKNFSGGNSLNRHMIMHSGQKPYECEICGMKFAWKNNMKTHLATHSEIKRHKCLKCGMALKNYNTLKRHTVNKHSSENIHKCTVCEKAFAQSSTLERHMLTHSDKKPHNCDECGKGFLCRYSLNSHVMNHIGEKSFQCHVCGKNYGQANTLNRHMIVHSGEKHHQCGICDMKFAWKNNLKAHMTSHSAVKPHKCMECGKTFKEARSLKRHMITHSAVKPHKCMECGKAFKESRSLKRHMITHT